MLNDLQAVVWGWASVRAMVSAPVGDEGWRAVAYVYPSPRLPLQFVGEGASRELAEAQLFARVRDAAEASGDASFVAFGTLRP